MSRPLQRILLVEDESDIRTIACMALEAVGGYKVLACASGQEAIRMAPESGADLILLDVMMPGLDGPSTLRELRKIPETAATPVVFMTAKVQPAEVAQYLALGALDVVAKPFDPMAVAADIQRIWDARPR
jgi:two-component system OmpR family response regulator